MKNPILKQIELAELLALGIDEAFLQPGEILELHEKCGPIDFYTAPIDVNAEYFSSWRKILFEKRNRSAEVALSVENERGTVLLHTKPFYPPGIYRIPTGGIHPGERVLDALHRELDEETSFRANSFVQSALLVYQFKNDGQMIPFISHVFKVKVDGGEPHPKDDAENITGYQWIEPSQLADISHQLKSLTAQWRDWGVMRAVPHDILMNG